MLKRERTDVKGSNGPGRLIAPPAPPFSLSNGRYRADPRRRTVLGGRGVILLRAFCALQHLAR